MGGSFFTEDAVCVVELVVWAEDEVSLAEAVVEDVVDFTFVVALDLADVGVLLALLLDLDEVDVVVVVGEAVTEEVLLVDVETTAVLTTTLPVDARVDWDDAEETNDPQVPNSDWQPVPQYASVDPQKPFTLEKQSVTAITTRLQFTLTCNSFQKSSLGMWSL